MINPKKLPIILLLTFFIWLFFWGLCECWYAFSFDPILSSQWKQFSFILGIIAVFVVVRYGKRLIM